MFRSVSQLSSETQMRVFELGFPLGRILYVCTSNLQQLINNHASKGNETYLSFIDQRVLHLALAVCDVEALKSNKQGHGALNRSSILVFRIRSYFVLGVLASPPRTNQQTSRRTEKAIMRFALNTRHVTLELARACWAHQEP